MPEPSSPQPWTMADVNKQIMAEMALYCRQQEFSPALTDEITRLSQKNLDDELADFKRCARQATEETPRTHQESDQRVLDFISNHYNMYDVGEVKPGDRDHQLYATHNKARNKRLGVYWDRYFNDTKGHGMQHLRGIVTRVDGEEIFVGEMSRCILAVTNETL